MIEDGAACDFGLEGTNTFTGLQRYTNIGQAVRDSAAGARAARDAMRGLTELE